MKHFFVLEDKKRFEDKNISKVSQKGRSDSPVGLIRPPTSFSACWNSLSCLPALAIFCPQDTQRSIIPKGN